MASAVSVDDMLTIGAVAKQAGLTVRALRLYDGLGLLRPAVVEANGYRRYTPDQVDQARLIALLRSVDLPLADVAAVLGEPDPAGRAALLTAWWAEQTHVFHTRDQQVAALAAYLHQEDTPMTTAPHAIDPNVLADAISEVLLACDLGGDPTLLNGVLAGVAIEPTENGLRLVATDRYRLAIRDLPSSGPAGPSFVVEGEALGGLVDALRRAVEASITPSDTTVHIATGTDRTGLPLITAPFPNYRPLLAASDAPSVTATVDAGSLRSALWELSRGARLRAVFRSWWA